MVGRIQSNFCCRDCVVGLLVGSLVGLLVGWLDGSSVSETPTSPILTSTTVRFLTLAKGVSTSTLMRVDEEAAATRLALVFESGFVCCPRAQDMSGTPNLETLSDNLRPDGSLKFSIHDQSLHHTLCGRGGV